MQSHFAVTLRISVHDAPNGSTIRVEGRLERRGVSELQGVLEASPRPVHLDLSNLLSLDAEGLAALRRLRQAGFDMLGTPPALASKILEDAP